MGKKKKKKQEEQNDEKINEDIFKEEDSEKMKERLKILGYI